MTPTFSDEKLATCPERETVKHDAIDKIGQKESNNRRIHKQKPHKCSVCPFATAYKKDLSRLIRFQDARLSII